MSLFREKEVNSSSREGSSSFVFENSEMNKSKFSSSSFNFDSYMSKGFLTSSDFDGDPHCIDIHLPVSVLEFNADAP